MKGEQRLEHIIFRTGSLMVPKNKTVLQKLLSLYHPHKDKLYKEHEPKVIAENEIDILEMEIEALNAAQGLDIDTAEAVMRVEIGSKVNEMSSKELKRDLLLYAKRNPALFLELVNDENVVLRNFGIKATEMNIIKLSSDQRTFMWGSNDRKLMNVPFDEHPYSVLNQAAKAEYGCSSKGTFISFLSLDPQLNVLWSEDSFNIPISVALIPKFLSTTFSSLTSSKNNTGFLLAYNSKSLLSSLELISLTLEPISTLITASAVSISKP
jgi:hypothetical protein